MGIFFSFSSLVQTMLAAVAIAVVLTFD